MEKEATRPHNQVATEGDQENLIVLVSAAAQDALDAQPHEQQVRHGIDDLCRVRGGIVVLAHHISLARALQCAGAERGSTLTSSHQFRVEVTGLQKPAFAGGYGIEGRGHRIVRASWEKEEGKEAEAASGWHQSMTSFAAGSSPQLPVADWPTAASEMPSCLRVADGIAPCIVLQIRRKRQMRDEMKVARNKNQRNRAWEDGRKRETNAHHGEGLSITDLYNRVLV